MPCSGAAKKNYANMNIHFLLQLGDSYKSSNRRRSWFEVGMLVSICADDSSTNIHWNMW